MIVLVHLDHYHKKVRLPFNYVRFRTALSCLGNRKGIGLTILGDFAISRDNGGVCSNVPLWTSYILAQIFTPKVPNNGILGEF